MTKKQKLKEIVKQPSLILYYLDKNNIIRLPDQIFIKILYKKNMKTKINLSSPKTFNEKLNWLKLYDRNPNYTQMVDKYEVREYIKEKIGEQYLIPLIGVYERFEDINFEKLPNQFVLKCTHDSGSVILCKDKARLNVLDTKKRINKCLKRNFYYLGREWPYKNVKPRIIIEKYMIDCSERELKDYKFMCFHGKVKYSFVCSNRNSKSGLNIDIYDLEWNKMSFSRRYPNSR